jgi:uncharacterized membrane protein YphA (DoxX/SURF4 family)
MKNIFHFFILSPWPSAVIRFGLALVFLYAGSAKLIHVKAFARLISQYDLIPDPFLPVVAIGLPVLELVAGIGLLLSLRGSLSLTLALLIIFASVLWYDILRDLKVDCGCFSVEELKTQSGLWEAFYRDLLMMIGVLFLYGVRWFQVNGKEPKPLWVKIKRII